MIENEKIEEMMFELEERAEKALNALEGEYAAIRAGRANPRILDRIEVEAYGGMSKLIELGNVSALDARCLQINLWDKSLLKAVEKAILQSNIGITPTNDGQVIRLVFPVMTEERRKELVKQIKKMGEEAKVQIRNQRRDAMDVLKKMKASSTKLCRAHRGLSQNQTQVFISVADSGAVKLSFRKSPANNSTLSISAALAAGNNFRSIVRAEKARQPLRRSEMRIKFSDTHLRI